MSDVAVYRFLYSSFGLLVGMVFMIGGLALFFWGIIRPSGKWKIKIGKFEISDAAPGIAFAFLGLVVIYLTRL